MNIINVEKAEQPFESEYPEGFEHVRKISEESVNAKARVHQ